MKLQQVFKRSTKNNDFKNFYAAGKSEGKLTDWYIFTKNGDISRVIKRTYIGSRSGDSKEMDIPSIELPKSIKRLLHAKGIYAPIPS